MRPLEGLPQDWRLWLVLGGSGDRLRAAVSDDPVLAAWSTVTGLLLGFLDWLQDPLQV